jgi:hypothetical protein
MGSESPHIYPPVFTFNRPLAPGVQDGVSESRHEARPLQTCGTATVLPHSKQKLGRPDETLLHSDTTRLCRGERSVKVPPVKAARLTR